MSIRNFIKWGKNNHGRGDLCADTESLLKPEAGAGQGKNRNRTKQAEQKHPWDF